MATLRTRRLAWIGIPVVLIVLIVAFWNWDWFIPLVEARASAALGRRVTIEHLHVRLGRIVEATANGVVVANPPDWSTDDPPFVAIRSLTVQADAWACIHGNSLVLPLIGIDGPSILLAETTKGAANFRLSSGGSGTSMKIGDIRTADGNVHVVIPNLKADFNARIETRGDGDSAKVLVEAKGTYAAQPIAGHLVGGALLSLRDTQHPWPVVLNVANGPTRVTLDGTIRDPLAFQGADLKLGFSGPDMGLLEHLVGFPIPQTPVYQIAGKLDLEGFSKIRFRDFRGRLGNSDLEGTIEEQPGGTEQNTQAKPVVTLNLRSSRVDLVDLNGFIGGTPGRPTTANATPAERRAAAQARASSKLLPDTAISIPKLQWADIHLRYRAARIEGRDMPLDDLSVATDVVGGRITVHPISFGIGKGRLSANVDLTPSDGRNVHAKIDLRMQNLDVSITYESAHRIRGVAASGRWYYMIVRAPFLNPPTGRPGSTLPDGRRNRRGLSQQILRK